MSRGEGRVGRTNPALLRRNPSRSQNRETERGREERLHDRNALARVEGQQLARRLSGASERGLKFIVAME